MIHHDAYSLTFLPPLYSSHGALYLQINRYAKEVEKKKVHFAHYNILPLHVSGAAPAIMELPEVNSIWTSLFTYIISVSYTHLPSPRDS